MKNLRPEGTQNPRKRKLIQIQCGWKKTELLNKMLNDNESTEQV